MKFLKLIYFITLFMFIAHTANTPCSTSTPLTGCITCPSGFFTLIDLSTKANICTDILNCTAIEDQNCIACDLGLILSNGSCITGVDFCLSYNISDFCVQCQPNYFLDQNNSCLQDNVPYCTSYSGSVCTQCEQKFMMASLNCTISSQVCLNFDKQFGKCLRCPSGSKLDSSGLYCLTETLNCLQYSYNSAASAIKCSKCKQNYLLNGATFTCDFSNIVKYLYTTNNVRFGICINMNLQFISSTNTCIASSTSISYCKTNSTATQCSQCLLGFYLTNFLCSSCQQAILNCIACSNSTLCQECSYNYYLLQASTQQKSQCIACSTFNCDVCYSTSSQVVCSSCQRGYTLYQGECYDCGIGNRFDILTKGCISCQNILKNCQYCDEGKCTWCASGFVLNGSSCVNTSLLTAIDQNVAKQLIIKSFPDHQFLIYKNQTKLLENCQQSTNGYACLCSSVTNVTSLCYKVTSNLINLPVNAFSNAITDVIFQQNSDTIRLLSQLPLFNSTSINLTTGFFTSLTNFANVIQTISNVVRRNLVPTTALAQSNNKIQRILFPAQAESIKISNTYSDGMVTMFLSMATGSMKNVYSLTQTTQIYGNGYYFKYTPASISDTKTDFISTNLTTENLVYVWFDNYVSSLSLTGNFYVYQSGVPSSTVQVKVKQLYFPSKTYTYAVYKNQILQKTTVSAGSDGFLTLSVSTSNLTSLNSYQVKYSAVSSVIDTLYTDQRIQQIFYQMSFIYVLIFLVAYLFFIPYCTIVDLCDKHSQRRKRVRSQDLTVTQQRQQQDSSQQQKDSSSQNSVVIAVNYKDFFPIYNIANTPRPRRLLKLCLFIVNLQHGITFLTLIYFNLQANSPVLAVVLAIPAYLCTVIMGYLCGLLVLFLPGTTKYLVNLVSIGYWIMWVILMPKFLDSLYYPYIYIFAIVFIFIDLLIDFLQTFLVYFVVKNSQRQINMFKCIATWLSYRGFYQFDKLAKQMVES